jgi:hypothetical protein
VTFTSQKQLDDSTPKTETERKRMQNLHHGQRYNAPPLFQAIDPIRYITCILHVVLRLVDNLFAWTIKRCVKTNEQEDQMNLVLKKMGIHVKKLKKTKEEIQKKAMKETKFHGRDCKKILTKHLPRAVNQVQGFKAIIDAMHYDEGGWMNKAVAIELWDALTDLIDELEDEWDEGEDVWDTSDETHEERDKRARKAQELAGKYLDLYVEHVGADNVTLYLHVVFHHAPSMIRRVGSLSRWSMQALEHRHSLRKTQHRHGCNHRGQGGLGKRKRDGTHSTIKVGYHDTILTRASIHDTMEARLPERSEKTINEGERKRKRDAKKGAQ